MLEDLVPFAAFQVLLFLLEIREEAIQDRLALLERRCLVQLLHELLLLLSDARIEMLQVLHEVLLPILLCILPFLYTVKT